MALLCVLAVAVARLRWVMPAFAAAVSLNGALFASGQSDLLPPSYAYRKFNDDRPSVPTVAGIRC